MLTEFKVKNFKCFKEFEIKNLGRVNIFLGKNNVGKTSLLEAIYTYACGTSVFPILEKTFFRINRDIDIGRYALIEKVLNTFNSKENLIFDLEGILDSKNKKYTYEVIPSSFFKEINSELEATSSFIDKNFQNLDLENAFLDWKNTKNISFLFNLKILEDNNLIKEEDILYPFLINGLKTEIPYKVAQFMDNVNFKNKKNLYKIYSLLKRDDTKYKNFIKNLNDAFKEDIKDIEVLPYPDGTAAPISIRKEKKEFIPLFEYGEGLQKYFSLLGSQFIYKNSFHCIDEMGDGLHPEAQGRLGLSLSQISKKNNNQIFSTTQSLEFIENYLTALKEHDNELLQEIKIITLKNIDNQIRARVLNGKEALKLIVDNNLELR